MISSKAANRIIFVLSLAGCFVTLYLTLAHKDYLSLQCGRSNDCEKVALDPSAHGFGIPALEAIPTAAFGLLMYVSLAALSFARVASPSSGLQRRAADLQWVFSFVGVLVSAWLTYLEAYVIEAWCKWCVASAVIIVLTFLVSSAERMGGRVHRSLLTSEGEAL
jgi:uncharacterized membrane protein